MKNTPFLYAYDLKTGQSLQSLTQSADVPWMHFDYLAAETKSLLNDTLNLSPIVVDMLTSGETRPSVTEVESGWLVSLRGVNLSKNSSPEDMVSIRAFITQSSVVSTRHRKIFSVLSIVDDLNRGIGPNTPQNWLVRLISLLTENMASTILEMEQIIASVEEVGLEAATNQPHADIVQTRRQIIAMKRYLMPQIQALAFLLQDNVTLLNDEQKLEVRQAYEHTMRYIEEMDALKERATVLQEELNAQATEAMNQRMYVLSIVAAVFLPLGFFTGLLGVNVGGIPGTESSFAFGVVCVLLVIVVVLQVWIFKKNRWF